MAETIEMPSAEARLRFREALDNVRAGGSTHITRYNRSEAVIVSFDWYERACRALLDVEINSHASTEESPHWGSVVVVPAIVGRMVAKGLGFNQMHANVYHYVLRCILLNQGRPPTTQEIADGMHVDIRTARRYVTVLRHEGLIDNGNNPQRCVRLANTYGTLERSNAFLAMSMDWETA